MKVYAVAAGQQRVPLAAFLVDVAMTRALRIATVALFVGSLAQLVPRRMFVPGVVAALTFFGIGLVHVVGSWS